MQFDKKYMAHNVILQEILEIHSDFGNHHAVYTDGTEGSNVIVVVALDDTITCEHNSIHCSFMQTCLHCNTLKHNL